MDRVFESKVKARANDFNAGRISGTDVTVFIQWLVDNNAVSTAGKDFEFIADFFMMMGLVKKRPDRVLQ